MAAPEKNRWSQHVTETSDALSLEPEVFTLDDPAAIAKSLKEFRRYQHAPQGGSIPFGYVHVELLHQPGRQELARKPQAHPGTSEE